MSGRGYWGRRHHAVQTTEEKKTEDWRTLLQAEKLENLKEEMRRNKVDVMGISDVRWET